MKKQKLYVTQMIPEQALRLLEGCCSLDINREDRLLKREELLEKVKSMHAVITTVADIVDAALMDAAGPQCRIIAQYADGVNNIDIAAATRRGIFITNTPDILAGTIADLTWALLLATARRVVEGDRTVRTGRFSGWSSVFMLGTEVNGKTLGIVGAGRIGQVVARRASGFDMKILYTSNNPKHEFEKSTGAIRADLPALLKESDFISLHVPLTPATHHLIGAKELGMMKKSAILINTARGPVIDEKVLAVALRTGRIGGAGLDVFEREPAIEVGLLGLDNVVLCPHLGNATFETRERMGLMAVENVLSALRGEVPPQCLNPLAAGLARGIG
jgi:glyoxylate reductase